MRKRVIGIVLCFALMCALLPCAFADESKVLFHPEGATSWSADENCGTLEVTSNDGIITIPANPVKTNYVFKGWSTVENDGTKIQITPNEAGFSKNFDACNVPNGGTLYAIWEVNTPSKTSGSTSTNPSIHNKSGSNVTLLYNKDAGGSVVGLLPDDVPAGTIVLIQAVPDENYRTLAPTITTTGGISVSYDTTTLAGYTAYKFVMPASDVNIMVPVEISGASSLTINPTTLTLSTATDGSKTATITATVVPAGAPVTWSSRNDEVATVSSSSGTTATVTAKKAGTTKIVATCGDKTAECEVTVEGTSISFALPTTKFTNTNSYNITATTVPTGATGTITWTSSNSSVLKVVKDSSDTTGRTAVLYPLSNGDALITATLTNSDGTVNTCSRSATVALSTQKYKVIANGNGCWYYDAPSSYSIVVNAPYTTAIKSISIYNSQLGTTYYPVSGTDYGKTWEEKYPNQTIITFYKPFMQTLPRYTYQVIKITFEDGTASTYLHILSATGRPITGDTVFNPYWIALALGAAGMGAALTLRRKEKQ